ncbi:MAG: hypothetical protein JWO19_5814 [Bryobacterales bacterium]|nr:hypothetical protein [Bryobacterales bacterium]
MRSGSGRLAFAAALVWLLVPGSVAAQQKAYSAPRTRDGQPDLQGIWEARNTAAVNLEDHGAGAGMRAGKTVVVDPSDGRIPYRPDALTKRNENFKNRATADPLNKCYLPGVPRVMYLPYPLQIFQTPKYVAIASEFAHTTRTIYMDGKAHYADAEFWMGDSRGRWEGDTLVVDVGDHNAETWFDMSGNFHSEAMRLIERLTRTGADTIEYEVTVTDPKVFTQPWIIRMPLYLHREPEAQLFEYECHLYLEEGSKGSK